MRRSGATGKPRHSTGLDRLLLALEHEALGHADRFVEQTGEPCGEEDLPARRVALQARCRVDDITDGREVVQRGVAHVPDERLAEIEPDAQLERRTFGFAIANAPSSSRACSNIMAAT